MPLLALQPPIPPLPPSLSFANKTALLTSPTRGITLATAHLLLAHNLTHLVLTTRSKSTGHALLQRLQASYPAAKLTLLAPFDLADPAQCVEALKRLTSTEGDGAVKSLDILVLGAADGGTDFEVLDATRRERLLQVNALSPALLVAALFPLLQKSAHAPARVLLVGSRAAAHAGLFSAALPEGCQCQSQGQGQDLVQSQAKGDSKATPLLDYLSTPAAMGVLARYPSSKALAALLVAELAERTSPNAICPTAVCPGMVATSITDALPWYLRPVLAVAKFVAARTVDEGARAVVLGLVMGDEGRGGLWRDGVVGGPPFEFMVSERGRTIGKTFWTEAMREAKKYIEVPEELLG